MKVLELYAGSGSVGNIARALGHEVFSVDWTAYDNIDLQIDISKLTIDDIPWIPDIVWMSPDCTTYCVPSMGTHRHKHDRSGKTDYAKQCDVTNIHTLSLLDQLIEINPDLVYYIENPRGNYRKMPWIQNQPIRHTVWYCSYGFSNAKPTDIFTNNKGWIPRPECHNFKYDKISGEIIDRHCHHESARRSSKTGTQGKKNSHERSKIPAELCAEILIAKREPIGKKVLQGGLF